MQDKETAHEAVRGKRDGGSRKATVVARDANGKGGRIIMYEVAQSNAKIINLIRSFQTK